MALYVSIDIETTGVDPSKNAILSIGATAVRVGPHEVAHKEGDFYVNMRMPVNREWDPQTHEWWNGQPDATRDALFVEPLHPAAEGINKLLAWMVSGLERKTINRSGPATPDMGPEPINMVFYPLSFDYRFLTQYVSEFVKEQELRDFWFKHRETTALDIQTMAMSLMQVEGYQARRNNWPDIWRVGESGILHNALDDARMQMGYFLNIRKWARENFTGAYTVKLTTEHEEGK